MKETNGLQDKNPTSLLLVPYANVQLTLQTGIMNTTI